MPIKMPKKKVSESARGSSEGSCDTMEDHPGNFKERVKAALWLMYEIALIYAKILCLVAEGIYRSIVPASLKPVEGETVLITGAGSGIGREIAFKYAFEGATVVCWDINEKGNLETIKEIERLGYPKAHAYVCNVTDRQQVLETAAKVQSDVGDVTILINNAGIMPCHPFTDHSFEEIQRVFDVNVIAHFWTIQAFLPAMKRMNHGHIVGISSAAGMAGFQYLVPYCASKYAVRGLTEALHLELQMDPKCKVKATVVCPTIVSTGLFNIENARTRFPCILPVLTPREVAEHVIKAQRSDVLEATVPNYLLTFLCYLRLFPVKVCVCVHRFLNTFIESDL